MADRDEAEECFLCSLDRDGKGTGASDKAIWDDRRVADEGREDSLDMETRVVGIAGSSLAAGRDLDCIDIVDDVGEICCEADIGLGVTDASSPLPRIREPES